MIKKQSTNIIETYGAEETAKQFVFPVELTVEEQKNTNKLLKDTLAKRRAQLDDPTIAAATMLQLRYQIEDYLKSNMYDPRKSFGSFLKAYINGLNKRDNEFANEIDIQATALSQYIHNRRNPPNELYVRLELHSGNIIPAGHWYQVIEKKNLHILNTNTALRKVQQKHVKRKAIAATKTRQVS